MIRIRTDLDPQYCHWRPWTAVHSTSSVVEPKLFVSAPAPAPNFQKVSAPAPEPAPAPTLAFYLPFITDFILKSRFFMFFMKEYQPNSHAGFYTIWIFIFFYLLLKLTRSRSRNFAIPAPAKSSGSLRLRLHNTVNQYLKRKRRKPDTDWFKSKRKVLESRQWKL